MTRAKANRWGTHRSVTPALSLPQGAEKLDATLPIYSNEIICDLEVLHLDSASLEALKKNSAPLENQIRDIVSQRGKMHNPITNSGGVFLGRIREIGEHHPLKKQFKPGDKIVSLVSLTLTPLHIEKIGKINPHTGVVEVKGHAILFETGMAAPLPTDFSEGAALAILDVCGAPAQSHRHVQQGESVLVLGLGKAGRLMATEMATRGVSVYGLDANPESVAWCETHLPEGVFGVVNAQKAEEVANWVETQTQGKFVDMVLSATNVEATEMSAILSARPGGRVLFFGMNTSFQRAALGAEGVSHDVTLLMGSGYVPGHADLALNLVRENPFLKEWFETHFA